MTLSTQISASVFTTWTEYPFDPLNFPLDADSSTLFDDYYPSTIWDEQLFSGHGDPVLYKMWTQGEDNLNRANIALSYSNDGINWTLKSAAVINDLTGHPSHPVVIYDANGFGGGPYFYQMWYWTGQASIVTLSPPNLTLKSALSVDGINWTTPVTNTQDTTQFLAYTTSPGPAQPFHQFYGFGTVIYNPNATSTPGQPFSYPYAVFFDSAALNASFHYQEAVGLAYSTDGVNWIRYGTNPVLIPSTNSADWDGKYEYRASVIKLAVDGMYHMYYAGANGTNSPGLSYAQGIGHAQSADGINWTKDPSNPIFIVEPSPPNPPSWDDNHITAPSVVVTSASTCSELLQMWFSGGNTSTNKRMGFATLQCLPPFISSLNPNSGFTSGGNTVIITGGDFTETTSVLFGSTPATSFVVNSDTSITAIAPPGSAGVVDVTIVTTHGTSFIMPADRFTYIPISFPLPPSNFTGVIKKNKFPNKTECILQATWTASPSDNIIYYRIYQNGRVVGTVSATSPLVFKICLANCSASGFEIAVVNVNQLESSRIQLVVVS